MHSCRDEIVPGDVVVRQGNYYVVVGLADSQLRLVAAVAGTGPRHRSDVRASSPAENNVAALASGEMVYACRAVLAGHRRHYLRLGAVSSALLDRIGNALRREHAARRLEAAPGLGSALHALTASTGRQVSTGRHS